VVSCSSCSVSVLLARRGQSSWSVILRGQSFFLVVVVSQFFRNQSVVLIVVVSRGQSFFVDGVYILWWLCTRIYCDIWPGKTAVNVWINVRGWVEHV